MKHKRVCMNSILATNRVCARPYVCIPSLRPYTYAVGEAKDPGNFIVGKWNVEI